MIRQKIAAGVLRTLSHPIYEAWVKVIEQSIENDDDLALDGVRRAARNMGSFMIPTTRKGATLRGVAALLDINSKQVKK